MFLSICMLFNLLFQTIFQTITQFFHKALSHINIRTRNKKSAGVLNIREPQAEGNRVCTGGSGRINKSRGRPA